MSVPISPTDEPDLLAGAVLRSLNRHLGMKSNWSFFKTLLISTLTFGIAPLLIWPRGLRRLIESEQSQFRHLAEWMRLRSGQAETARLVEAANRIRPMGELTWGPVLIGIFVALALNYGVTQSYADGALLASTYGFGRNFVDPLTTNSLFFIWTAGLLTAYAMHWLQLIVHVRNVRGAVRAFNDLTAAEGLPPVRALRGFGLRPIWLTAALIMLTASALWAIPMMLAGGMQRRYVDSTGPALRAAVADRLRDLLLMRRPVMRWPQMVELNRRCSNVKCRGTIGRIALYCPRCGTHVGPEVDELT